MFIVAFCDLFFRNDPESLERLKALCRDSPQPDEDRIVAYLEADLDFIGVGVIDRDRFTGGDLRGSGTRTDGTWIWPSNLAHYIRHYHMRIPVEFAQHMASRNWLPPRRDEIDMARVAEEPRVPRG